MSATGWPPIDSSWTLKRPNYLGWVEDSRYSSEAQLGSSGLSVQFGGVYLCKRHVRVLGVTISSDLSLGKHVANVCSSGVRRSLDTDSMKTLVHAFVISLVDYCSAILAGSPRYITDKLQCLLNAAARLVTATRKFDHGHAIQNSWLTLTLTTCEAYGKQNNPHYHHYPSQYL